MKKLIIVTMIAACVALCAAPLGAVKIYAQIYLQAPAE